jgi:hypothetical protein
LFSAASSAARKGAKRLDLDAFRRAIFNAVVPDEYVHYREMWDYTSKIEDVIHSINELLKEGFANEVIELAEYAKRPGTSAKCAS